MIISQTQWQRRILKVFPRVTHICPSLFHSIFNLIATNGAHNPSFHYQEQSKKEQMATLQILLSFLIFRMLSCTYVCKLRLPQATDSRLIQISETVSVPYWYAYLFCMNFNLSYTSIENLSTSDQNSQIETTVLIEIIPFHKDLE